MTDFWSQDPRDALRVSPDFDLATFERAGTPGWTGSKKEAEAAMAGREGLLDELQERLFAQGRAGGERRVLIVVQGLDTAGKGGIARHVMGMIDPQGVALRSFGVPTPEELRHHYLWRIKRALPRAGQIGLFDRSHYEDVLVVRVDELVEPEVWGKRYDEINRWEKQLVDSGTIVLKFAMMVSKDEQAMRLMERIDRPDKRWKYSAGDLDTRAKWDDFQAAYADVFRLTNTDHAPWYVLPADRKWYPRLAVTEILTRTLAGMDLQWPKPRWQPAAQRRRLVTSMSAESLAESVAGTEATVRSANEASLAVQQYAADIRANGNEAVSAAAEKEIAAKRDALAADLAATLEQKQQLLAQVAPGVAPTAEPEAPEEEIGVEETQAAQAASKVPEWDPAKKKSKGKGKGKKDDKGKKSDPNNESKKGKKKKGK